MLSPTLNFRFYTTFLAFICCWIMPGAYGQTSRVDEIKAELNKTVHDTARLRLMVQLSKAYSAVDPVKKFKVASDYKELAESIGNDTLIADAYLDMGISYGIRSKPDSAIYFFTKGYEHARKHNYLNGIGRSLSNIGFAYDRLDDKQTAIRSYLEALQIFKKINFVTGINQCYINIGSIYNDMRQHRVAEGYFLLALKSFQKIGDESGIANAMYTLGNVYLELKDYSRAEDYLNKSLRTREKLGDLSGIAKARLGLGRLFVNTHQYDEAVKSLMIGLENTQQVQDSYVGTAIMVSLADAWLGKNNIAEADKYGKMALEIGRSTKSKVAIADALEVLVEIEKKRGNIHKAFEYQTEMMDITDSIQIEKVVKDVTLTEFARIRGENDGLQRSYAKTAEQNTNYFTMILITSVALLLVIVLLVLYYRRNTEKRLSNEQLKKQQEEIIAANIELEKLNNVKNKFFSIVSHDLRAPLANLKMLLGLYRDGDIDESELRDLISRLEDTIYSTSNFLDNLLEWSKNQLEGIVIRPEVVALNDLAKVNIDLVTPQLSSKKMSVKNNIGDDMQIFADPNMINVVIRNILTNCIKFCRAGDTITMEASREGDRAVFVIRDNGPGISEKDMKTLFSLEHTMSSGSQGETGHRIGLVLCREMLLQNNGSIIVDSEPGEGTNFIIELPAHQQ